MPHYNLELIRPVNTSDILEEDTWAWDRVQMMLSCCGLEGPHDWDSIFDKEEYKNITNTIQDNKIYPKSCCSKPYLRDLWGDKKLSYCDVVSRPYTEGCKEVVLSQKEPLMWQFGFLCLLQVLLIIGAHIISFQLPEPSSESTECKTPAEVAWARFVEAQHKPNLGTRSKSCQV